jgi:antitoxin (DNA-binding transcriptional repressor) of toxin-antitoxin stability system
LAFLAYNGDMGTDDTELSVSQARNHFSDAVNRATFGGEITYVTRGRAHQRAAAIVPADLVERYEAMIDLEDGRIAQQRLADLKPAVRQRFQPTRWPRRSSSERDPGPCAVQYDPKALKELTKLDKPVARRSGAYRNL